MGTNWVTSTIGGLAGNTNTGSADGLYSLARFNWPNGITVDTNGNVYVVDTSNDTIREGVPEVIPCPVIFSQPQSLIVTNGQSANFIVGASGTQPLYFQWLKNGTNLTDGGNISGSTNNMLTLNPVTTSDAGNYWVVVSNSCGSVTSSNAVLTVGTPVQANALTNALTGFYTQVAEGDPDFDGGPNAGGTLATGMIASQLGPNGLPVLSTNGIKARLGTSSDMDPTTHELLWWSAGAGPYVSLDLKPVQTNSMPLNWGLVNFYPTGQTGDSSYFRSVHWQGTFTLTSAGSNTLFLQADDDVWVFIDRTLVAEDHYGSTSNSKTAVSAGSHLIDVFYNDRFTGFDQIVFTSSIPLSPVPGSIPVINSFSIQNGTNFLFGGTNGTPNNGYSVLSSTNVVLPMSDWVVESSNNIFDGSGAFSVTNSFSKDTPQKFFRLRVP